MIADWFARFLRSNAGEMAIMVGGERLVLLPPSLEALARNLPKVCAAVEAEASFLLRGDLADERVVIGRLSASASVQSLVAGFTHGVPWGRIPPEMRGTIAGCWLRSFESVSWLLTELRPFLRALAALGAAGGRRRAARPQELTR